MENRVNERCAGKDPQFLPATMMGNSSPILLVIRPGTDQLPDLLKISVEWR
jgi:hypothetical protein